MNLSISSIVLHLLGLFILNPFLLYEVCASAESSSSSSWARLQISPDTLGSMRYGEFLVNIYEHAKNQKNSTIASNKRYFYGPLGLLDNKSAISKFNSATKKDELRFRIEMWNDHVESSIVNYLRDTVGHEIKPSQVQIIQFEKVLLETKETSTAYSLSTDWQHYGFEKSVWFTLSCFERKNCDHLKDIMLVDPTEFHNLNLRISLSSQESQTKEMSITIKSVLDGDMTNTLLQRFEPGKDPLLTASDTNRLLSETKTNVIVETFQDYGIVSPNTGIEINKILNQLLIHSQHIIQKKDDKVWDSVFWNDDNYRPDKSSKTLNEIYNKQDNETQKKMVDAYKNTNAVSAGVEGWGVNVKGDTDFSREGSISKEDMDKLYQESRNHVEWDGKSFVPKPLSLSRINLGKLRDTKELRDKRVDVSYLTTVLTTPVRFSQLSNVPNTDEWIELKQDIKDLKLKHQRELLAANRTFSELLDGHENLKSELQKLKNDNRNVITELQNLKTLNQNRQNSNEHNPRQRTNNTELSEDCVIPDISFHANRTNSFGENGHYPQKYVSYENAELNRGNGLNAKLGIFKAPRVGTYLFNFHAEMDPRQSQFIYMKLNDVVKTRLENYADTKATSHSRTSAMSIILPLNVNDFVGVFLFHGAVVVSYFSGILIQTTN